MDRKRMTCMALGFGALLLVVAVLLAWGGRRQTGGIVLPESPSPGASAGDGEGDSQLNTVSVTPETVGAAISVLSRPAAYSRTQTVETFWSGGAGQSTAQVRVSGGRTRLDAALPGGGVRHTLLETAEGRTLAGVWYDDETEWALVGSAGLTADRAGRAPTYETVRDLPPESIAQADYREAFGSACIYVETRADGDGYADRYWVSVQSGLLLAAERLWEGAVVYRFSAGEPETAPQEEELFLLPDGAALAEAKKDAEHLF